MHQPCVHSPFSTLQTASICFNADFEDEVFRKMIRTSSFAEATLPKVIQDKLPISLMMRMFNLGHMTEGFFDGVTIRTSNTLHRFVCYISHVFNLIETFQSVALVVFVKQQLNLYTNEKRITGGFLQSLFNIIVALIHFGLFMTTRHFLNSNVRDIRWLAFVFYPRQYFDSVRRLVRHELATTHLIFARLVENVAFFTVILSLVTVYFSIVRSALQSWMVLGLSWYILSTVLFAFVAMFALFTGGFNFITSVAAVALAMNGCRTRVVSLFHHIRQLERHPQTNRRKKLLQTYIAHQNTIVHDLFLINRLSSHGLAFIWLAVLSLVFLYPYVLLGESNTVAIKVMFTAFYVSLLCFTIGAICTFSQRLSSKVQQSNRAFC